MNNLHCRLIFDIVKKKEISEKNLLKIVKFQNLVENVVMCRKYSLTCTKFANFLYYCITCGNCYHFRLKKMVTISTRKTRLIQKFANSRLYFPYFTTFRDQILEFYYFLKVLFRNFVFCLDLSTLA